MITSPATAPIPFWRLVRVEWTKATDTRAARWLLVVFAVSAAGTMLVPVLAPSSIAQTHISYLRVAALGPLTILLPVVTVLMFTGEWSQRSIMTTFTQEPRRIRVVNAKLTVSALLGVGAAVYGGAITAAGIGAAAASGRTVEADLTVGAVVGFVLFVLLNVLAGVALGALLQNSAAAIASSFALPATFALLGTASKLVADWLDMSSAWSWVLDNEWSGHVPQIAVSTLFWVALPLAAGVARTTRRDIA
jgi:ABC-type transport system involved in multi-copper enzyme maturation permease subunit